MEAKICIFVCNSLVPEVSNLLQNGNYPDVTLKSFPAVCSGFPLNNEKVMDMVADHVDHFSKIFIFVSACRATTKIDQPRNSKIEIIQLEQCFELFFSLPTIYHYIKQGNYLVSNGWLRNYKHHIKEWGFDPKTAKTFFGESMKQLLLLDTELPEDYRPNLEALSDYMGLSYEILPIGNSHLKNLIETIIFNFRNENERSALNDRIALITRESADYALLFHHLQKLIEKTEEEIIVNEIFTLVDLLFAPKQIIYQRIQGADTTLHYYRPNSSIFNFNSEDSFEVEMQHAGEPIGNFGIIGVKFPEYLKKYQSTASVIGKMGSLAISNARKYVRLEEAKIAISRSEKQFHSLFANMNEGVALHAMQYINGAPHDYRIIDVNARFVEILGLKKENVINKLSTEAYQTATPPYLKEYNDVIVNNKPTSFETYFDSMDRYFAISVVPWQENGFATIFADITARKKSEETLRKLSLAVEQSPVSIVITDTDGNIEYSNPVISKITGYTIEELSGKNPRLFSSGEKTKEEYDMLWNTIKTGNSWQGEFHNKKKNGDLYWESALISPIKDDGGKIIKFLAIKEDITLRKEAEIKLSESSQKFKSLSQSATKMLSLKSVDEIYEYITNSMSKQYPNAAILFNIIDEEKQNVTLIKIKGISSSILKQVKKLSEFDLINSKFKLTPSHLGMFKSGSFYHFQKGLSEFSGSVLSKLAAKTIEKLLGIRQIYTIGITKGNMLFAAVHFLNRSKQPITDHDYIESFVKQAGIIIERKYTEERLRQSEIELRETVASKDKFFSIISHDLRSPFSSIVSLLGLLLENSSDYKPDEFNRYLQSAHKTAQSTFHLLENLLEWSRLQRGVLPFNPEKINMDEFVNSCDPSTFEMAKKKQIKIEFDFPKGLTVNADSNMLHSIMRNLITNAIKFTKDGGWVKVTAETQPKNMVTVSIKDNGIGMDEKLLNKLFGIGTNVNRPGTKDEPSSGLGLILCKEFVEIHGGKIWAESKVGIGSTFCFTLPK